VTATHHGKTYRTNVRVRVALDRFVIGHTIPRDARVKSVRLDGRRAEYRIRLTNRGREVLVRAPAGGRHELVVKTR
jgi:hypothetical protein